MPLLHVAARVVEFELIYGLLLRVAITLFIRILLLPPEFNWARRWNVLALIWRF
jgi:hypothetical protein